jgi:hypothetical protein
VSDDLATPDFSTVAIPAGLLLLEHELCNQHRDDDGQRRMEHVFDLHLHAWKQTWPVLETIVESENALREQMRAWSPREATEWFIQLAFATPFAPYEPADLNERDLNRALCALAPIVNRQTGDVEVILSARHEAFKAFRSSWTSRKIALGVGGILLVAGGIVAPFTLPAALGAAAGLTGGATMTAGLAALGGGAAMAGGFGMAGGTLALGGISSILAGGGSLALQATKQGIHIDPALVQNDLVQRMVYWKVVVLDLQGDRKRAREMIEERRGETAKVRATLDEERSYSYPKSDRIKEIEERIKIIDRAIEWMEKQIAAYISGK